jgi:hypothetical protein
LAGVLVGGAINWYSSRKLESRREEFAASMEQARSTFMQELQDREQRFLSQQERVRLLQQIKSKLGEHKAEFDQRPDLIEIVELLRKEAKGCSDKSLSPEILRNLPGFLEPIGTYLEFHTPSSATPEELSSLYRYFAEEVRLCRQSKWMWSNDDYHTSPFWSSFRRFVAATEKWAPEPDCLDRLHATQHDRETGLSAPVGNPEFNIFASPVGREALSVAHRPTTARNAAGRTRSARRTAQLTLKRRALR